MRSQSQNCVDDMQFATLLMLQTQPPKDIQRYSFNCNVPPLLFAASGHSLLLQVGYGGS